MIAAARAYFPNISLNVRFDRQTIVVVFKNVAKCIKSISFLCCKKLYLYIVWVILLYYYYSIYIISKNAKLLRGKVVATCLSVPTPCASSRQGDSVHPRQREAGSSCCPSSTHGDNVMWFQAKNIYLSLTKMHIGSESQSQLNITTSMWVYNSWYRDIFGFGCVAYAQFRLQDFSPDLAFCDSFWRPWLKSPRSQAKRAHYREWRSACGNCSRTQLRARKQCDWVSQNRLFLGYWASQISLLTSLACTYIYAHACDLESCFVHQKIGFPWKSLCNLNPGDKSMAENLQ